ncbi:MAG: hypothetical protein N2053_00535 [Chitinispirillaceae bacterium]|nr:hypothetical protein [Chitinispirillaceae bacterium]
MKIKRYIFCLSSLVLVSISIFPIILKDISWSIVGRNFLATNALSETGATNIVSAIYLGYRVYDTIGETIVLLAALMGTIYLLKYSKIAVKESEDLLMSKDAYITIPQKKLHTDVITFTAGKLSPIILLFGWYVMFFGHQSPGGGFQGGIVLSSGITFLIIGRRFIQLKTDQFNRNTSIVEWIETSSLFFILTISVLGAIKDKPLFSNALTFLLPSVNKVWYIVFFNIAIGIKVGAGVALLMILLLRGETNND